MNRIFTLEDLEVATGKPVTTMVIHLIKTNGKIYQLNSIGDWWLWGGKRGWLRVRKPETLARLEAFR